jgi:hypothetical protein
MAVDLAKTTPDLIANHGGTNAAGDDDSPLRRRRGALRSLSGNKPEAQERAMQGNPLGANPEMLIP